MVISKGNVSRGYVRLPSFTDLSVIGISHWHRYHAVDTAVTAQRGIDDRSTCVRRSGRCKVDLTTSTVRLGRRHPLTRVSSRSTGSCSSTDNIRRRRLISSTWQTGIDQTVIPSSQRRRRAELAVRLRRQKTRDRNDGERAMPEAGSCLRGLCDCARM